MKIKCVFLLFCFVFCLSFQLKASSDKEILNAAKGVISRVIGSNINNFRVDVLPTTSENKTDTYQVSASNGVVTIKGNSTIAITRGFYDYLRSEGIGMVTWGGKRIELPEKLPDMDLKTVSCPFEYRQYFNVCTFGYTTVWWDWNRWEKELDWMALHGINMPLAMVGQEAIWTRLWESYGISRKDLDDFFTGPAFLPWQRMGNVNKHGGPLSDEWMENQLRLQHKILERMRELGMTPVAPAFSGFVPPAFAKLFKDAKLIKNSNWGSFPDGYQTYVLAPDSPLFVEIGKAFIHEYEKEYGMFNYYLADTFNELTVPVSAEHRYDELASFGKAVFSSIDQGNPKAVWIMQGWMFGNDQEFWDKPSVEALLRDVPDERVMILDLADEMFEGWKKHDSFHGKEWISSVIHNFGGNNPLYGDLNFFAQYWSGVVNDKTKGSLKGVGMAPEGIENNEVIYELLTDAAWLRDPVDLDSWIKSYMLSRYGKEPPALIKAWDLLRRHVYTHSSLNFRHAYQSRPSMEPMTFVKDTTSLREIVDLFLSAYDQCSKSELYLNDLIETAAYFSSTVIDRKIKEAISAQSADDIAMRDNLSAEALALMNKLNELVGLHKGPGLEKWIEKARNFGQSSEAKNLLEKNARMQITIWGGPDLYDYASKVWSGLISDFYAKRWEIFFKGLKDNKGDEEIIPAIIKWEEVWTDEHNISSPVYKGSVKTAVQNLLSAIDHSINLAPSPEIAAEREVVFPEDSVKIIMRCSDPSAVIRYTINGGEPDAAGLIYKDPFYISGTSKIIAKSFISGFAGSIPSEVEITEVRKNNGMNCLTYVKSIMSLAGMRLDDSKPVRKETVYSFDASPVDSLKDDFIKIYLAEIEISSAGEYTFYTESDDGSRLFIGDSIIVDNDGFHAKKEVSGKIELQKGKYPLRVDFFEGRGAEYLKVTYSGPGFKKRTIKPSRLFFPKAVL